MDLSMNIITSLNPSQKDRSIFYQEVYMVFKFLVHELSRLIL
ncbi:hypothetical protein Dalk_0126 [Desulfatibacillum aliphaticivorans]|uniref:Uncharacterized protein n=1 Tax=Desulfatibacillum aliphaticivorans TaxID=218208 RepID=B8FKM1_DESAL|nr:hypothetical protein Dalk_0126 [Desulfatibacillum aliphaticivorans]